MKIFNLRKGIAIAFIAMLILSAITLSACFSGETVISFNTNGGNELESITLTGEEESLDLPTPKKEGYVFMGWYENRGLTKRVSNTLVGDKIPTQSTTYYARWEEIMINIVFNVEETTLKDTSVKYGTQIDEDFFPSLEDFPDYEWGIREFTATYNRVITATLKASVKEPEYTVTYYQLDTINNEYEIYVEYKGKEATQISVPTNPTGPNDGKDYYFKGWYYDRDGEIPCEEPPTEIGEADVVLYAIFVEILDDSEYLYYEETADGSGIMIMGVNEIGRYRNSISIPSEIDGKKVVAIGKSDSSLSISELSVFNSTFLQTLILPSTITSIGDWAFFGCSSLNRVVFGGNSISYVGDGAFSGCDALEKITLPDNLTTIGAYAFASLSKEEQDGAQKIKLEESLVGEKQAEEFYVGSSKLTIVDTGANSKLSYIGDYAFYGCNQIQEIKLSKVMRDFNYLAFENCGIKDITFYSDGNLKGENGAVYSINGRTLYYYSHNMSSAFTVPEGVTVVAENAFNGNEKITAVILPESLTEIKDKAFYNCSELNSVVFNGENVSKIGKNAFSYCIDLSGIILPESLVELGEGAFYKCSSLANCTFKGSGLQEIKKETFYQCELLNSIAIPAQVTAIGDYAFYQCNLIGRLTFGSYQNLVDVGDYAFADCYTVAEVILPSSIRTIGDYAFAGISQKMQLQISEDTDLGKTVVSYGDYAFANTSITKFTLSTQIDGDENLGKYVFKDCTSLKRVSFSYTNTYSTVPEGLFYGCSNVEQISFPNNITTVGKYAFYNCIKLEEVTFNNVSSIKESAFENCIKLVNHGDTKRVLPINLTEIENRAFYNCVSLTSITVPNGLEAISAYAFAQCTSLTDIYYDVNTTLKSIGEYAFEGCTSIVTAQLPYTLALRDENDTEGLIKNPFYGCTSLKAYSFNQESQNGLYVEDGVIYYDLTQDGKERAIYAYPTAKSFVNMVIENDVAKIERYAFFGCTIIGLTFNEGAKNGNVTNVLMTEIGDYAFSKSRITKANVSYRVKNIGKYAFAQSALNELIIDGVTIPNEAYNIVNVSSTYTDNYLTISDYAFYDTLMPTVTIPIRTTRIEKGAFEHNTKLNNVIFEGGNIVELSIGERAFYGNARIEEITLPSNLNYIGKSAFEYCVNVDTVTFSANGYENGIVIEDRAFAHLHYLYKIDLPANLTVLGKSAFEGNTRLKIVNFGEVDDRTLTDGLEILDGAFVGDYSIDDITIPSYVTLIGESAFNTTHISKITFINGDKELIIGKEAFYGAINLKNVIFPDNLTSIGEGAFKNSVLTQFQYANSVNYPISIGKESFANTNLVNVELGERIEEISELSFANTETLVSVIIVDGATAVGERAFYECKKLTSVELGDNVVDIGKEAFYGTAISTINGKNFNRIGEYAFANTALTELTIETDTLTLENGAFYNNALLKEVVIIVEGDLVINESALANAVAMTTLSITAGTAVLQDGFAYNAKALSDGLTFIETDEPNYYFDEEEKVLYSVDKSKFVFYPAGKKGATFTLKESVVSVADYAFYGNSNIINVIIAHYEENSYVTVGENSFSGVSDNLGYYVAEDAVNAYKNEWHAENVYAHKVIGEGFVLTKQNTDGYYVSGYLSDKPEVVIPDKIVVEDVEYKITGISDKAFINNTFITSVTIVGGVKNIGLSAFNSCLNLQSVHIADSVTGIKNYAFYNCPSLVRVTFEEGSNLISIGNYAFAKATILESITLPEKTETIGLYAFAENRSLVDITFNEGLKTISNNALENCVNLVTVTLPSTLSSIGSYVFNNCQRMIYIVLKGETVPSITVNTFAGTIDGIYFFVPGKAEKDYCADVIWRNYITNLISEDNICDIQGYEKYVLEQIEGVRYKLIAYIGTDEDTEITINAQINEDIKIESIGEYVFGQFVKTVTLGEGIETIEDRAFVYASNMESITLPDTLKVIKSEAFANLKKLTVVNISEDCVLTTIGERAFVNCSALNAIAFPKTVVTIEKYAFASTDEDGMHLQEVIFRHEGKQVVEKQTCYVSIYDYAFAGNVLLENLTFNCYLAYLGDGAFSNCSELESIYLNFGENTNKIEDGYLTVIDKGDEKVFENCNKLSIIVPTEQYQLRYKTFWDYVYDANRVISAMYVVNDRIYGDFIYSIINSTNKTVTLINYLGDEQEVVFPSVVIINNVSYSVVRVGRENNNNENVVNGYVINSKVQQVTIPNTVNTIGGDSFRDSLNLKKVIIVDALGQASNLTSIEENAFSGCISLEEINIPKTVATIAKSAFAGCTSLNEGLVFSEYAVAPSSPNLSIGVKAFANCTALESVRLPNQLLNVGERVFENCTMLERVEFAVDSGIDTIGAYAFSGTAIKEIVIPASVKVVNDYAFNNCKNLIAVYLHREYTAEISTLTATFRNVFNGVDNVQAKVYVPEGAYASYRTATGWSVKTVVQNKITDDNLFAYRINENKTTVTLTSYRGSEKVLTIPRKLTIGGNDYLITSLAEYFGNTTIERVVFPADTAITSIGASAFKGCTGLKEIHIPNNVTTIGANAFENCKSLIDVKLPAQLEDVAEYTFFNCTSLKEIVIPSKVYTLGNASFYGCVNLARVIIEFTTVNTLGNMAFSGVASEIGDNLCIIAPTENKEMFASQWLDVSGNVYAEEFMLGDYIVQYNADGSGWKLIQYLGEEYVIDLTELDLSGMKIKEIVDNAVINDFTEFIVDDSVVYGESLEDRITNKNETEEDEGE